MKKLIVKVLNKPFVKNVIVLATGTIGAQIIKMLLSPIITRIYGPEAFGIMGVFISVIQIITPIAALTYPIAIVLPKSDLEAKDLKRISLYISYSIAFFTFIVLLFFLDEITEITNIDSIYLFYLPLVILFTTYMQVNEQWLIRTKQFGIASKATFYQSFIVEVSKIGIGLFSPIATVLITLTALSNGIKAFLMNLLAKNSVYKLNVNTDKRKTLRELLRNYKDFPLLRAPQAFIDAITQSLPVLLLTTLFSPVSAGYYTLCRTVLSVPTSFIGKSVGDVFYPRINEAALKRENMTNLLNKSVLSLSAIGIIPFGVIIIIGPWLFGFVFGNEWTIAGEYARWIALSSFFRFINEPCLRVLPVLSAQVFHLISTIVHTITRVIVLIIGFYIYKDDIIAITLLGIVGAIVNVSLIIVTILLTKKFDNRNLLRR